MSTLKPRKRNLTNEQRRHICLEKEKNPKITQAQLALWVQEAFGLSTAPTQATISNVLAKKAIYLNSDEPAMTECLTHRSAQSLMRVEDALERWMIHRLDRHSTFPSNRRIKKKAAYLAEKHRLPPHDDPTSSDEWIHSFIQHRRTLRKEQGRRVKRSHPSSTEHFQQDPYDFPPEPFLVKRPRLPTSHEDLHMSLQ